MININDFDTITQTDRVIDDTLKQAIFVELKKLDPRVTDISLLDFTVYEGVGSFRAGPFNYNAEGYRMLTDEQHPINQYSFGHLPTLIVRDIYDYIHPSEFVIEKHPFHDYQVKVQLSENNHFQLLVFPRSVMILQVNGIDIVTLETLSQPHSRIEQRQSEINTIWNNAQAGDIPHKLASEFSSSTLLYRREEIQNAKPWKILEKRPLTRIEHLKLRESIAEPVFFMPVFFMLIGVMLLFQDRWEFVFVGTVFIILSLKIAYKGKPSIKVDDDCMTLSGQLKVHPKVIFTGPIEAKLLNEDISNQLEQKKEYEFNLLSKSKYIFNIKGLNSVKPTRSSRVRFISFCILGSFCLLCMLMNFIKSEHSFSSDAGFFGKIQNYIAMNLVYFQPETQINYVSNPNYVPKVLQKVKINALIQCDNQTYIQLCDKVHVLKNKDEATPLSINLDDYLSENEGVRYITALNAHYWGLKPSNEILLEEDYTLSPVFTIIARNNDFFYTLDNFDSDDKSLRHDLTNKGFEYLSQPISTTFTGIVKQVDFINEPTKRWVMHLSPALGEEELALARYMLAYIVSFLLILIYFLYLIVDRIRIKRLIKIHENA
ncbi:hypothetical protein [Thorsellia anophelis]|uniref:Uncharacterized protein n=1 Tax=Thorsellia anophelis DSM 18579 TaxID=1123402 RepID=A0A1I0AA78_9GAMM|nr:hypothetical protein [Thorsellia anophelis]SES90165.1 hypothetical protein SAMN02583745_00824 [Thorsellia anophelis DSM 18579]